MTELPFIYNFQKYTFSLYVLGSVRFWCYVDITSTEIFTLFFVLSPSDTQESVNGVTDVSKASTLQANSTAVSITKER